MYCSVRGHHWGKLGDRYMGPFCAIITINCESIIISREKQKNKEDGIRRKKKEGRRRKKKEGGRRKKKEGGRGGGGGGEREQE